MPKGKPGRRCGNCGEWKLKEEYSSKGAKWCLECARPQRYPNYLTCRSLGLKQGQVEVIRDITMKRIRLGLYNADSILWDLKSGDVWAPGTIMQQNGKTFVVCGDGKAWAHFKRLDYPEMWMPRQILREI